MAGLRKNGHTYTLIGGSWKRKDHYSENKVCSTCGKQIHNKAAKCSACRDIPFKGGSWGKHTEASKEKMSRIHKGKHYSPRTEFKKGMIPWSKGLTKEIDERLRLIGEKLVGRKFSKERIENMKKIHKGQNKGKTYTEIYGLELGKKMREIRTGQNNHFFGKKHTLATRKKVSDSRKGKVTGEKHHNWKGGVAKINNKLRQTFEFKLWREKVFQRDNYTCQECTTKGGTLCSHHIFPISDFKDLIFCPQNGITLCEECHNKLKYKELIYADHLLGKLRERGVV